MKLVKISERGSKHDASPDAVPLFDILLIALLLSLLSSHYILAEGISIDAMPVQDGPDFALVDASIDVLNAKSQTMIIYDGKIQTLESFLRLMGHRKPPAPRPETLLIKTDKRVDSQTLLSICEAAKKGGYSKILIATRKNDI